MRRANSIYNYERLLLIFLFFIVSISLFSQLSLAATHSLYSNFASPENGFVYSNNSLVVQDSIIYRIGFYSVNGSAWTSFNLSGAFFNNNSVENWLINSARRDILSFGLGEHYIIVYSCTLENNNWNCHDNKWQLLVVNNILNNTQNQSTANCSDGVKNQNETGVDCGGPCSACVVPANCSDGVKNQNETGIDCGGPCPACVPAGSCATGEYLFNGVCLLNVSGQTFFVSPTGNDNWSGNFTHPWRTWGKAFNDANIDPGDIVYFRGGIYYKNLSEGLDAWYYPYRTSGGGGYRISRKGVAGNPVRYFNYPLEEPILDGSRIVAPSGNQNYGIRSSSSYTHIKGLTIRNILQINPNITEVAGFVASGTDAIFENCKFYNIGGAGMRIEGGLNFRVINSDAWNCSDPFGDEYGEIPSPGNDGYGFEVNNPNNATSTIYFKNCRAWNNGDDGFAYYSIGYVENDGCWSFANGQLEGAGNGFKLGFYYNDPTPLMRKVVNSIAAYNRASGLTTNDRKNRAVSMNVFNNIFYHNGYYPEWIHPEYGVFLYNSSESDAEELKRVFRNNIAYDNEVGSIFVGLDARYTHSNNTWDSKSITVNSADFVSLPANSAEGFALLSAPRKSDGSLPDLGNNFKLAPGSDLIDAGVNVGLPYLGSAPDLGPYEYKP
jgi:hypothetical protein